MTNPTDEDRTLDLDKGEPETPEPQEQPATELPVKWEPLTDDELVNDDV